MKKLFIALCLTIAASTGLKAQLFSESFDYPAGDSVQQHGWVTVPGVYTNIVKVTAPGLDFAGYQLPGVGNATTVINVGEDVYKQMTGTVNSGSVYGFFLVKVTAAQTGGDYCAAFLPATSPSNFACRVYVKSASLNSNNIAFGIIKNALGGGGLVYTDTTYTLGTTYLLVAKHTFVAGATNDVVSLTVFKPGDVIPLFEPAPTITGGPSTTNDVPDIGRFALRQGSSTIAPTVVIDEIYAGTDWGGTLPVELASFTSSVNRNNVNLVWSTASENNNSGFDIERSSNGIWSKIGNVTGNGTSSVMNNYKFSDLNLASGKYSYRLKQIDYNGNFEYFTLNNEVIIGSPDKYSLAQNYPNPFNPSTKISFDLPYDGNVNITVYDMSGKEAASLVKGYRTAGYYSVDFNAAGLASGVYFYTLNAGNFSETKRMMLVK